MPQIQEDGNQSESMMKISKQEKCIIILHEIYGVNEHIQAVCEQFSMKGFDVVCPNLLNRESPFHYAEEEKAYRNFVENIGFDLAFDRVKNLVHTMKNNYEKVFILGFSVGATIAWRCSALEVDGVVAYYGSRIRDYLEVVPKCPTLLFFPTNEKSFHIETILSKLRESTAEIRILHAAHGFTDPSTVNYDETLTKSTMEEALEFLEGN